MEKGKANFSGKPIKAIWKGQEKILDLKFHKESQNYVLITESLAEQLKINRAQALQILNTHRYPVKTSCSFGVREAKQLVATIASER